MDVYILSFELGSSFNITFSSFDMPITCSSSVYNSHSNAASTAANASIIPNPYQRECQYPAPFITTESSNGSFTTRCDVFAIIPCTCLLYLLFVVVFDCVCVWFRS